MLKMMVQPAQEIPPLEETDVSKNPARMQDMNSNRITRHRSCISAFEFFFFFFFQFCFQLLFFFASAHQTRFLLWFVVRFLSLALEKKNLSKQKQTKKRTTKDNNEAKQRQMETPPRKTSRIEREGGRQEKRNKESEER
jgi:hypothetical protein